MSASIDRRKLRISVAILLGVVSELVSLYFDAPATGLIVGLLLVCVGLSTENQLALSEWEQESGRTQRVYLGNNFFARLARKKLEYARELVSDYDRGVLHLFDLTECLDAYTKFFDAAKAGGNRLLASSLVDPKRVWEGGPREANRRFLARGGRVTRIFFPQNEARLWADVDLRKEIETQKDMGVDVLICFQERVGNKALICDFLINPEDGLSLEYSTSPDITPWAGKLIADQEVIAKLRSTFDQLSVVAEPWDVLRQRAPQETPT